MKLKTIISFFSLLSFVGVGVAQPAMNLDHLKKEIEHYYESGEYNHDVAQIEEKAERYLANRIANNNQLAHPKKLALVLDIDDTALSNYADDKMLRFGGTMDQINVDIQRADDPAVAPTLRLYQYAMHHGVSVFFITGRKESLRRATEKNLRDAGYTQWTQLYLEPNNYHAKSAALYKSTERKKIIDQGYDIVINVGDQYSDLAGGLSDTVYKYPNYIYFIP